MPLAPKNFTNINLGTFKGTSGAIRGALNLIGKASDRTGPSGSEEDKAKSPIADDNGEVSQDDEGNNATRFTTPGTDNRFVKRIAEAGAKAGTPQFAGGGSGGASLGAGGGGSSGGGAVGSGGGAMKSAQGGGGGRPPQQQQPNPNPENQQQDPFNPQSPNTPGPNVINTDRKVKGEDGKDYKIPLANPQVKEVSGNDKSALAPGTKGLPTLVVFSGKEAGGKYWCGPCEEQKGKVTGLPNEFKGAVNVHEVAATKGSSSLAKEHKVSSFPSYILFDANGKEVSRGSHVDNTVIQKAKALAAENDKQLIKKAQEDAKKPPENKPEAQKPETQTKPDASNTLSYKPGSTGETKAELLDKIFRDKSIFDRLDKNTRDYITGKIDHTCTDTSCTQISVDQKLKNAGDIDDNLMQGIIEEYNAALKGETPKPAKIPSESNFDFNLSRLGTDANDPNNAWMQAAKAKNPQNETVTA